MGALATDKNPDKSSICVSIFKKYSIYSPFILERNYYIKSMPKKTFFVVWKMKCAFSFIIHSNLFSHPAFYPLLRIVSSTYRFNVANYIYEKNGKFFSIFRLFMQILLGDLEWVKKLGSSSRTQDTLGNSQKLRNRQYKPPPCRGSDKSWKILSACRLSLIKLWMPKQSTRTFDE